QNDTRLLSVARTTGHNVRPNAYYRAVPCRTSSRGSQSQASRAQTATESQSAHATRQKSTAPSTNQERMMKSNDLRDKVVLTTGASSGIGAAIAREAAARGAISILVGRDAGKLDEVEHSIRSQGGRSKAYVTNLTIAHEVELLRSRVAAEAGVPDILINN